MIESFKAYMEKRFNKLNQQVDSLHKEFYKEDKDMTAEKVLNNWAKRLKECELGLKELSKGFIELSEKVDNLDTWMESHKKTI